MWPAVTRFFFKNHDNLYKWTTLLYCSRSQPAFPKKSCSLRIAMPITLFLPRLYGQLIWILELFETPEIIFWAIILLKWQSMKLLFKYMSLYLYIRLALQSMGEAYFCHRVQLTLRLIICQWPENSVSVECSALNWYICITLLHTRLRDCHRRQQKARRVRSQGGLW